MAGTGYAPPQRILTLEKGPGKRLVDHRGFPFGIRRQREILRGEQTAGHQGDSHGFEVSRPRVKADRRVRSVRRFSFDTKAGVPIIATQQIIKGIGRGKHSGNCFETRQKLRVQTLGPRPVITVERRVHPKEQDIAGVKARIDAFQILQCADKQASAGKNQNGERDLRDHKRASEVQPSAAGGASPKRGGVCFERRSQIQPQTAKRGREAEQNSSQNRSQCGECKHAGI